MISVALPGDICSMRQEETLTDKGKPQAKKCLSNGNHKKKTWASSSGLNFSTSKIIVAYIMLHQHLL
jgi:hypothetical protein